MNFGDFASFLHRVIQVKEEEDESELDPSFLVLLQSIGVDLYFQNLFHQLNPKEFLKTGSFSLELKGSLVLYSDWWSRNNFLFPYCMESEIRPKPYFFIRT